MTNGETQTQQPENSPIATEVITREENQAQSEFLEIKEALTDRRATPDPRPGWILPRVDEKAQVSQPQVDELIQ